MRNENGTLKKRSANETKSLGFCIIIIHYFWGSDFLITVFHFSEDQENNLTQSKMVAAFFKYMVVLMIVIQCATCVWFIEACLGNHVFTTEYLHSLDYVTHSFTDMHCSNKSWVVGALQSIS